jgi:hypothetical protein
VWREEDEGNDGSVGGAVAAKEDEKRVRWWRHRKGGGHQGGCGPWCMGDRRERERGGDRNIRVFFRNSGMYG